MLRVEASVGDLRGDFGFMGMRATDTDPGGAPAPSRAASILAWSWLALTLVLMVMGHFLDRAEDGTPTEEIALTIAFSAFPVVGALIASRRPRNAIGWMFIAIGFVTSALVVGQGYAHYGLVLHPERDLPWTTLAAWIENWGWLPLIGTILTLLLLLFPMGRPPSRRWKPVAWLAGGYISVITMLSMLEEKLGRFDVEEGGGYALDNPIGINGLGDIEEMGLLLLPVIPLALLCASSLIFRYRNAPSEERQQLKWVAVAGVLFVTGALVGDWLQLPGILFPILLGALPASIGVAILKHRLYDIDLIINRTLVYGGLTARSTRPSLFRTWVGTASWF
jgi:hypothetical protein